jgi:hypothetical protein
LFKLVDTEKPKLIIVTPTCKVGWKNSKMEGLKFVNYLANDSRNSGRKLVFVCITEDCAKPGSLGSKDIALFVDKVLEEK